MLLLAAIGFAKSKVWVKTVLHAIGPALRGCNSREVTDGRVSMNSSESFALIGALAIVSASAGIVAWLCWTRRR